MIFISRLQRIGQVNIVVRFLNASSWPGVDFGGRITDWLPNFKFHLITLALLSLLFVLTIMAFSFLNNVAGKCSFAQGNCVLPSKIIWFFPKVVWESFSVWVWKVKFRQRSHVPWLDLSTLNGFEMNGLMLWEYVSDSGLLVVIANLFMDRIVLQRFLYAFHRRFGYLWDKVTLQTCSVCRSTH